MTQAAKAQEPSMEEILASIRRIIADDDAAKTPAKAAEPAKPAPAPAPAPAPKAAAPAPVTPAPRPAPPAAAPVVSGQDDIDAMFAEPASKASDAPAPDILELTEAMEALPDPEPPPALRRIEAMADVVEAPPGSRPAPPPPAPPTVEQARRQFQEKTEPDRQLLSPATTAAVDSAFNSLAQTVLIRNDLTLDGMVREMLRPMLKAWLDDNLPNMVERLVRAEIERVSRGRTSS
jgi:cell pole-organizing protein PopZ